ncbi:MAG: SDR family NAD(P)-dependent oxidoreductase [Actinomycetia bacterium]|nr:SDR family NAD(P)-dependent oxidoreductase [Actinomycetes bacterium]
MPAVLVTGAGRGIGSAIASHLASRGWDVIAGVRNERDILRLTAAGFTPVMLDVANADHIAALNDSLPDRLDAVVNNAGVVVGGPMEVVTPQELRRQLDINVVGQIAVTQAVLPRLRESSGRVVFISSLNGKVSFPMFGPYCGSKFALEAVADALRMELLPWNIAVVIVEPAQTDTDMWRTADTFAEETAAAMPLQTQELYQRHLAGLKKSIPKSQKLAVPATKVAAVVETALTARRPRQRYVVGILPKAQLALINRLPSRARDRLLRALGNQPGRP